MAHAAWTYGADAPSAAWTDCRTGRQHFQALILTMPRLREWHDDEEWSPRAVKRQQNAAAVKRRIARAAYAARDNPARSGGRARDGREDTHPAFKSRADPGGGHATENVDPRGGRDRCACKGLPLSLRTA